VAYGFVHERMDILGFLWWLGGMPDQTRIDDSGALSPEEGKRGRIGPLNPAALGITQMVPQEFGEAHPVDLCQRDRLGIARSWDASFPLTHKAKSRTVEAEKETSSIISSISHPSKDQQTAVRPAPFGSVAIVDIIGTNRNGGLV